MQMQDLTPLPLGPSVNNRTLGTSESSTSSPEEQVIKLRGNRRSKCPTMANTSTKIPQDIAYILATQVSPNKSKLKSRDIASEYFEQSSPTPKKRKRSEFSNAAGPSDSCTSSIVMPNVTSNESHCSNGLRVRRRLALRKRLALKTPDTSISPHSVQPTKAKGNAVPSNYIGHRI